MGKKKPFTQEQINILKANKFTHSVTPKVIKFTLEFKKFYYDQIINKGKSSRQALAAAGYDLDMFEYGAIRSLRRRIIEETASPNGLQPPRGLSTVKKLEVFEKKNLELQRTSTSIKELQNRIVHLEKQVELLKKRSALSSNTIKKLKPSTME